MTFLKKNRHKKNSGELSFSRVSTIVVNLVQTFVLFIDLRTLQQVIHQLLSVEDKKIIPEVTVPSALPDTEQGVLNTLFSYIIGLF